MNLRTTKVSAILKKNQSYYISNPSDVFYLSGFNGTFGKIVIHPDKASFITDSRYEGLIRKSKIASDFEIIITKNFQADLILLTKKKTILFNKNIPLSEYLILTTNSVKTKLDSSLTFMRMIKDNSEIQLIKQSVAITEQTMKHIAKILKIGITERDLSLEFDYYSRKLGADGLSFTPIIAFNEHGAVPHHATSTMKLKTNTLVLVDAGVKYKGYASDLTRVFAFGIIHSHLKQVQKDYESVLRAKKISILSYKPGIMIKEADLAARESLAKDGLDKFFTHSLGHGIGLDVHEPPSVNPKEELRFEKGMVFSCEPGIYLNRKYGIRIEDDYLITDKDADKLGKFSDSMIICG
ncbi:MAG: M24 family metallopeptidase [bacterium]